MSRVTGRAGEVIDGLRFATVGLIDWMSSHRPISAKPDSHDYVTRWGSFDLAHFFSFPKLKLPLSISSFHELLLINHQTTCRP